jgi:low affinity Fe/Cu permease
MSDDTGDRHSGFSGTFTTIALWTSQQCGRASSFILACTSIIVWGATGPVFGYSDTWQLVINTGTTIITFLMVFLIQNTQNRDMAALHLKLDELIRVNESAHNRLLNLEDMTEEELARVKERFTRLAGGATDPEKLRDATRKLSQAEQDIDAAKGQIGAALPPAKDDPHD